MNIHLREIRPHPSKNISDAVALDPRIVNLTVGEPGYGPPALFLSTMMALLAEPGAEPAPSFNRYAHSRGVAGLRRAVADYYRRLYSFDIDPETQIIVTNGAAEAIWLTVFTLTNSNDDVIIPDPCYMLYEPIVRSLGRRAIRLAGKAANRFCLTLEDLERSVTPNTRLLMLNSPENPTGAIYERDLLSQITQFAIDRGIYLMHDEVFDCMVYDGSHIPALTFDLSMNHVIMVNSFSKRFGMTGWRLGWMIAPPDVAAQAVKAHTYSTLAATTPVQEAAAVILNDAGVSLEVAAHRDELRQRGRRFQEALASIGGFRFPGGTVRGGFYLFPDAIEIARKTRLLASESDSTSECVAKYLLNTCQVAVVPGSGFGSAGEGYVRISFAAPEAALSEAVDRFRIRL